MNDERHALSSPLFRALAKIAFTSVMVTRATDEHGASEIVYVNDRFTDLTGYSGDEVMGETPGMLQGPRTDREVLERLEKEVAEGRVFHGRTINYRKDGSEFEIEWKVERVIDIDDVTYYIAVQREAP
ncbi:PAS domain-containing protein [Wenzhouxiangella sp. EGI_FJ10305]|uniref:PAS domain-containing protein n=1 Tax=Wenzhouxiangella sp. EGI_FJ10305 TaxID=3243768 RepID=UPI0035DA994B